MVKFFFSVHLCGSEDKNHPYQILEGDVNNNKAGEIGALVTVIM